MLDCTIHRFGDGNRRRVGHLGQQDHSLHGADHYVGELLGFDSWFQPPNFRGVLAVASNTGFPLGQNCSSMLARIIICGRQFERQISERTAPDSAEVANEPLLNYPCDL